MATIDPRVDIGHVHLKVSDIDRALAFWSGVLGFFAAVPIAYIVLVVVFQVLLGR